MFPFINFFMYVSCFLRFVCLIISILMHGKIRSNLLWAHMRYRHCNEGVALSCEKVILHDVTCIKISSISCSGELFTQ